MEVRRKMRPAIPAIIAVAIIVSAAAPQAVAGTAGFNISWEINLTTIAVFASGALAFYLTIIRLVDKVRTHQQMMSDFKTKLDQHGVQIGACQVQIQILREEVLRDYLSVDAWRAIKDEMREDAQASERRVMEAISQLGERIDHFATGKHKP